MAKSNSKGRSTTDGQYIRLHRGVTESAAWKDMTTDARCLVLAIWERHNGTNNGHISFSHREAVIVLKRGTDKTRQAFKDAQEHGFLIAKTKGSFDWKVGAGEGKATEWELTTEPCGNQLAKKPYKKWQPKQTAVTKVGTERLPGQLRKGKKSQETTASGNQGSNQLGISDTASGNQGSNTYNIPHRGEGVVNQ